MKTSQFRTIFNSLPSQNIYLNIERISAYLKAITTDTDTKINIPSTEGIYQGFDYQSNPVLLYYF